MYGHHMEYVSIKVISSRSGTEFWIVLSLRPRCGHLVFWEKLKLIHQVQPGILLRNGSNTSELIGILFSFKSLSSRFILLYSCISEESTILMSSLQLSESLEPTWWCHISPTDHCFCQDLGGWGHLQIALSAVEWRGNGILSGTDISSLKSSFLPVSGVSGFVGTQDLSCKEERSHLRWQMESLQ